MNYRQEVLRTAAINPTALMQSLTMGALGLAGESGEAADVVKKVVFHGKHFDKDKFVKELGDVRWYLEYLAIVIGVSMEEIEAVNVAKLRTRYPEGFSPKASEARVDLGNA